MRFVFIPILILLAGMPAMAADLVPGPVPVSVVRVIDGDSFVGDALVWPGMRLRYTIRIKGIDTPETSRAGCKAEARAGEVATRQAERLLRAGEISLRNVEADKYFGRVLADVRLGDGGDVASTLIKSRFALPYEGGRRIDWCDGNARATRVLDGITVGATE